MLEGVCVGRFVDGHRGCSCQIHPKLGFRELRSLRSCQSVIVQPLPSQSAFRATVVDPEVREEPSMTLERMETFSSVSVPGQAKSCLNGMFSHAGLGTGVSKEL